MIFHLCIYQVRATNLQELVYKNGQAGVTKATVCITFDNSDKKQSPLGYEQYDDITVTRQVLIIYYDPNLIDSSSSRIRALEVGDNNLNLRSTMTPYWSLVLHSD